ncbi:MAG: hypothetical protein HYU75_10405 [Betaproteobacteria bacterium]|nr:hypothetical protein [Betaproteobacteria bacterium]
MEALCAGGGRLSFRCQGTILVRLSLSQALLATMEEEARWLISSRRTGATEVPNFLDYIHAESLKKVSPATVTLIE